MWTRWQAAGKSGALTAVPVAQVGHARVAGACSTSLSASLCAGTRSEMCCSCASQPAESGLLMQQALNLTRLAVVDRLGSPSWQDCSPVAARGAPWLASPEFSVPAAKQGQLPLKTQLSLARWQQCRDSIPVFMSADTAQNVSSLAVQRRAALGCSRRQMLTAAVGVSVVLVACVVVALHRRSQSAYTDTAARLAC